MREYCVRGVEMMVWYGKNDASTYNLPRNEAGWTTDRLNARIERR